jgi:hypothetical protein
MKTLVMVVGLVIFTGASVACFGPFSDRDKVNDQSCQGLSGQAKTDCEQNKSSRPR